ncbi:cell wall-associated hydrolase, invasion-associated protein [Mycobacteroides abscessus subsp. bolletii]|uniref:NlpC/P60 family protein n=1 Tax=Mycobacteroides abscessus TaxID=36809 RepID=UPI000928D3A6|nr:NlpC/P60 family protein [Mycobacteroides abscessus]SHX62091.1 cell wall-associated hydrolase, invasion-associated protein [Mycobacteroides abscessus subsp. bolletii]SKP57044.1 cell wall-associated hydrolase, invasion-associated protein [Mycobacteroides abscessus subsp. bolletii]SKP81104.1 cell wall-associated hydrolase, invasion-associated protein [Mycobacteroides abscessus subsp. bolletii]SKQ16083.1 cell wall-associated hydrolase, invasion-associated protein [Mycobacteroides abscessus subsp
MAKVGDIRHWKAETLEKLFDTASAKAASLHRLGEGMEQVANDLSTWGGVTAGAWKDSAGKTRVDLGDKADAAEKVAKAVKPAIDDVREVTNKLGMLDQDAQAIGATITDDGKVVATRQVKDTDKHLQDDQIARLQQQVTTLEQRATQVEQEIAAALRADVTDAPAPTPQAPPVALNASEPVGGADGNPPYPNGAKPTMIDGAKTIPMADNPPGYDQNTGPGPARDQAWKDYLSGKNADGTQRAVGQPPLALPKPEAVSDKALRSIGAAGRSQGVSYAWGGNTDPNGPSRGHGEKGTEADTYEDWNRIGFDCGGLVRYSVQQGAGFDPFVPRGDIPGTDRLDINPSFDHGQPQAVPSKQINNFAQVGDILVFRDGGTAFTGGGTPHTGLYIGNGVMLDAPGSGMPVRTDDVTRRLDNADVLRIKP